MPGKFPGLSSHYVWQNITLKFKTTYCNAGKELRGSRRGSSFVDWVRIALASTAYYSKRKLSNKMKTKWKKVFKLVYEMSKMIYVKTKSKWKKWKLSLAFAFWKRHWNLTWLRWWHQWLHSILTSCKLRVRIWKWMAYKNLDENP